MIGKDLESSLNLAVKEAQQRGHEYVTVEHILYALCANPRAGQIIRACGGSLEQLKHELLVFLDSKLEKNILPKGQAPRPTIGFQRVLQRSAQQVISAGKDIIHVDTVLIAIIAEEESHAAYFLRKQDVTRFDFINYISHGLVKEGVDPESVEEEYQVPDLKTPENQTSSSGQNNHDESQGSDEQGERVDGAQRRKGLLALYTVNLCEKAKSGKLDPVIGREAEIERTIQVLCRRRKNNPLYVGEAGVGKTALAEGLALRIVRDDVPEILRGAEIFTLDMGGLLAGTRYRGDFEQRFKGVLNELKKKKKSILFIDEIHTIMGAGAVNGGAMDASNLLKPMLASGEIRCMGSTTFKEYRQHFEHDHAMTRRFQRITVDEPSVDDAIKILKGLKSHYESFHKVHYSHDAIRGAVELSHLHIKDRKLPDKAIDVIDEVGASFAARGLAKEDGIRHVGMKDVKSVIAKIARIPIERLSLQAKQDLQNLGSKLREKVFGQELAIDALENAIRLSRSGLGSEDRPIGSFLFSGPTGVGKTELAKQLAETMGIRFIRFDMSEYMERHAVSRLIGAPPGYVGYDEGGQLTDAIHKDPYAVLLLDEIEKAHPDVHNILLQIMDHGTLTDSNGRETDFRNVIIIMTTNVGAAELTKESIGFGRDLETGSKVGEAIKQAFSPEFRNRLDGIIRFNSLPEQVMHQIVDKFVAEISAKLKQKRVELKLTDTARSWLAKKGYDPAYGARPMRRLIQEKLKKPLADELLFGNLKSGGMVIIDCDDDKLIFKYTKESVKTEALV